MKFVYVLLSSTPTLIGKTLRTLSRKKLNHSSISLDEDLNEMYTFARLKVNTPLVGGIIKENFDRLTMNEKFDVYVKIYRIPVTEIQHNMIRNYIYNVRDDEETYLYNLFAVIGYPLKLGCKIYKAYICSEFVIRALVAGDVDIKGYLQSFKIQPQDIEKLIGEKLYFEGNLKNYIKKVNHLSQIDDDYFCKDKITESFAKTANVISQLFTRRYK